MRETEEWLPIVGWPNYLISNFGQAYSIPRNGRPGRILASALSGPSRDTGSGLQHWAVNLWRDGTGTTIKVHRLVLEAFVGPRPTGDTQARHLDGNRDNNRLDNLKWGTRSENTEDQLAHGKAKSRTKCRRGHVYTKSNTQIRTDGGARRCLDCLAITKAARLQREGQNVR